jgi:hypothetical protein
MKNVTKKMGVMSALLWLFVMAYPTIATDATVFYDDIAQCYRSSMLYPTENKNVVLCQNNGGNTATYTEYGPFSTTLPNQIVSIGSGLAGNYTTLAVNSSQSARYGQAMFRLAKSGNDWMRVSVNGVANPQYPYAEGDFVGNGAGVNWHTGSSIYYYSGGAYMDSGVDSTTVDFFNITINYDLQADVYEVWLDNTLIIGPTAFAYAQTSIESISIGGAYWTADGWAQVLDAWQWKVSDTAIAGAGVFVPEPATMGILCLGSLLLVRGRRK